MKIIILTLFICFTQIKIFGQQDEFKFDLFTAKIENSTLQVFNHNNKIVFQKKFNNPSDMAADLDGDGINEYLVNDSYNKGWKTYFTLYIFNTVDSFYVADSINSGLLEPYETYSKEANETIIISGNPKFDAFISDSDNVFLPINCWKYENDNLFDINDDIYNQFLSENDDLIDFLENYFQDKSQTCTTSKQVISAIAAGYANYIHAGEVSMANQFLNKYYLCDDLIMLKQKLNNLIK